MQMKNHRIIAALTAAAAGLMLTGCASLPEGSRQPKLEITSVSVAQDQTQSGFNVEMMVRHDSLEPLEVRKILTAVSVNGRTVAAAEEEPDEFLITPRRDVRISRFIPSNLARAVEGTSLRDPMFYGVGECSVRMLFTKEEQDPFNPSATYRVMLNNGGSVAAHEE